MAFYQPLEIDSSGVNHSVPDHFEDICVNLTVANFPDDSQFPVYYAERNTVIDAIIILPRTVDAGVKINVTNCASGTAPQSGTVIGTTTGVSADSPQSLTINTDNNFVPAGSYVGIHLFDADGTSASTTDFLTVQLRVRTRIA